MRRVIFSRSALARPARLLAAVGCCLTVVVSAADRASEPRTPELVAAQAALEDGLDDVARRQLEPILADGQKPTAERRAAALLMARALFQGGRHGEVLECLRRHEALFETPSDRAAAGFWRAAAQLEMNETEAALAELATHDGAMGPEYALEAQRLRARCWLKAGRPQEASQWFEKVDEALGGGTAAAHNRLEWGKALLVAGRAREAIGVLERALAASAGDVDARQQAQYWMAQSLAADGQWDKAWNLFNILANDPSARPDRRMEAWLAVASLSESRTNWPAALAAVTAALGTAPTAEASNRCNIARGRLLLMLDRLDEGVAVAGDVLAAASRDPAAGALQLLAGRKLLEQKKYEAALEAYERYGEAFTNRTGQFEAWLGRGTALWHLNQHAEAADAFEQAAGFLTNGFDRVACLLKAADASFAGGQYRRAGALYAQALGEAPEEDFTPNALFQLAESLHRAGEEADADARFREIARKYSGHPFAERALFRLAEIREEQGRMTEAVEGYEQVMAIYTNGALFVTALHRRGLIRYRLFDFEGALGDFDGVIERAGEAPPAPQAYFMRGWCLYMMGRDEEAAKVCRSFVKRFPDSEWSPGVQFWLGEYAWNHGAYEEAEQQFRAVANDHASDGLADRALLWAGRAAAKQRNYLGAIEYVRQLAERYPASPLLVEARLFQGDALSELGEFSGAILVFDEIIRRYPDSELVTAAWLRKGDCLFTLGADHPARYEEAMAAYRAALAVSAPPLEVRLQAEYKIGRCLEKLGRTEEALAQYYGQVVGRYLEADAPAPVASIWFTRAAFGAADILEGQKEWRKATQVLERVVQANVSAAREAEERINRIRAERWTLF